MKYIITIAIFVIAFLSFSLAQIPTDSLVAYYPFNGNANDESGNGHDGVVHGSVLVNDRFGTIGKAYSFNGTSNYISTDFPGILGAGERSIAFWAKSNLGNKSMVALSYGDTNDVPGGSFRCEFNTSNGPGPEVDISYALRQYQGNNADGSWHFYTWIVPNIPNPKISDVKIYMDGVYLSSLIYSMGDGNEIINTPIGQNVYIGKYWNDDYSFSGCIDDIRIYNRALNENEIQALYQDDGLVAYYPFNGNANDESGNGNDGVIYGAALVTDRFEQPDKALYFDGIDYSDYVQIDSFPNNHATVTVTAWIKADEVIDRGAKGYMIFDTWYNFDISPYRLWIDDNKLHFNYENGASADVITTFFDTACWHLVSGRRYQSDVHYISEIFIDGRFITSDTFAMEPPSLSFQDAHIGCNDSHDENFHGKLDDIRIYNRALTDQEIKSLYRNYRQQIVSIIDIPNDQGGKVRIKWDKIYLDSAGTNPQITSYGVWRKIPPGMSVTKRLPSPMSILNDTLGVLYDYLGTVNATQSPSYNFVAQTLQDSSESGANAETFLITAHTSDPNVYYISDAAMGYSVDNIAPSAVTSLAAVWQTGPYVDVSWDGNPKETDFQRYEIYKSTTKNFVPSLGLRINITINPQFQDADVTDGYRYYYQVYSVDSHGNMSEVREVSVHGNSIPRIISLNNNWNMVSVPMDMDDYSKELLFPTAVSSIFKFDGSYQTVSTLENGTGYWAKFNYPQDQTHNGFYTKEVRINVKDGWNMIGSLSETVPVTNITCEPAGMMTSQLFEYSGSYQTASDIIPGKGYWIKLNGTGTLILSNGSEIVKSNKINITKTDELPPLPPFVNTIEQLTPQEFVLKQNFPNPFNPTTIIKYGLPEDANVTLSVFNTLGQEVGLLASGFQKAGYHEVIFDGSKLTSGVYFYRLQAGSYIETKKLLLMK